MVEHQRDFFITYSSKDERCATWIAATLEAEGYAVTIAKWDFRPGDDFMAAMDHALTACRHTLGVLSQNYLESVFAQAEWAAAHLQALQGKPRAFIPVRVASCDPHPLLDSPTCIDLVNVDETEARNRLLDGVSWAARQCRD